MSNFPAWYYGPNGEAELFEREVHVPQGWADAPFPGVNYGGPQETVEPEVVQRLSAERAKAEDRAAAAEKSAAELAEDLKLERDRAAGLAATLKEANARADDAEKALAVQVADLKAKHIAEVEAYKADLADLKAQIAKFDKDGDGKVGGGAPKAPKQ